jgi:hypothetical protein
VQKYWNTVQDEKGNPREDASVSVQQNGANATIYVSQSGSVQKTNPLTTDTRGYFEFYAVGGEYDLVVSGTGFDTYTITDAVIIPDSISVKQFGATGDGSTNDLVAIQSARTYCASLVSGLGLSNTYKPTLYFPPALGYKITGQLTIGQNINVVMDAPLLYAGAGSEAALVIGVDSATDVTRAGKYVLDVRRNSQSTWASETDVGIKFTGVCASDIWLKRVQGFTIGVQFQATANFGCFFNRAHVGEIRENKFCIDLASSNSSFANNNNEFFGGEYACTTSGTGISRYGVRLTGSSGHNANTWYGPSFELQITIATSGNPSGVAVPFLVEKGGSNRAHDVRMEGCSSDIAVITDTAASNNFFEPNLDARTSAARTTTISDSSYAKSTIFNSSIRLLKQGSTLVFDSGNLGWATNVYDGSTTYTVDGFDVADSALGLLIANTLIAGHDRYLGFTGSRMVVRWLETAVNKRFIVEFESETGSTTFGYWIKPYDATQTGLVDNPTPAHVFGEDANQFAWNAGVFDGGAYGVTGAAAYTYSYFVVDSLTKIAAFIIEGNNGLKLKRVRIYALDYDCSTWQITRARGMQGKYIASAIPTVGSYPQGTRIWRHDATSGGTDGWACTTKGTFGALAGVTATTTLNSIQVTVSSATNIETGMYITIVGVTGIKRVIGVSGTTVVIDVKADAAVAGAAVAYSTPVVKLMANLS